MYNNNPVVVLKNLAIYFLVQQVAVPSMFRVVNRTFVDAVGHYSDLGGTTRSTDPPRCEYLHPDTILVSTD